MTRNGPDAGVYALRRARMLDRLGNAVLLLPGAPQVVYSNDVHYRYRPDSNLRYLSGYEDPAALLLCGCGREEDGFILFVEPRDPERETWTGRRSGIDGAKNIYGAEHAYPLDEMLAVLGRHLQHSSRLYYAPSRESRVNMEVFDLVHRTNSQRPRSGRDVLLVTEAGALLDDMRLVKTEEEIAILREACRLSAAAHKRVMESIVPGMLEYQVEAEVEAMFRRAGCAGPAYGTIAAGGANATVLHYTTNDGRLGKGDLLLLDAGGEYGGYCADITRTMPVGDAFSTAQAELYELVLQAQRIALAAVKPGATCEMIHQEAVRALVGGMLELGLLRGSRDECLEKKAYMPYYMHRTSHWLGMDVHDVGSYRLDEQTPRPVTPGIVLTVEPGIYVGQEADAPPAYRGNGIRIEDDVLVTETGHEILTAGAPKDRGEVEALRRTATRA